MRKAMMPFVISLAGILIFLAHFWLSFSPAVALWAISAVLGISSVHQGMRIRVELADSDKERWMPEASVKIGMVILIGVVLSATFHLAPMMP